MDWGEHEMVLSCNSDIKEAFSMLELLIRAFLRKLFKRDFQRNLYLSLKKLWYKSSKKRFEMKAPKKL